MHESIATIESPEFINLQPLDINPLMSSCEIKVFYLGENRNRSYISEEAALKMAKTLRGAPIVGYYKEEDFQGHSSKITIEDGHFKQECLTVPYGFVAPDAKVWFQTFAEKDDFGNDITRKYLMTTGYLWTGQFEECRLAATEGGRPQSMELDEESLEGYWSNNVKSNMEFFIINDATISKLCILGKDVEPCFEGSSVAAPNISKNFSFDNNFTTTLFSMIKDLQTALEGGRTMANLENSQQEILETQDNVEKDFSAESENITEREVEADSSTDAPDSDVSFAKEDDKEEKKEDSEEKKDDSDDKDDDSDSDKKDEEDEKKKAETESACKEDKKKYALLEEKCSQLETELADLTTKYQALLAFKEEKDNQQKEELINSFYMLSEEDKKDVIANKAKYSLEEIESKLSILFTRQRMAVDAQETESKADAQAAAPITYNLDSADNELSTSMPDWMKLACEIERTMNF